MIIIYRISDNGYTKIKYPNATKRHCLANCLSVFAGNSIDIFLDTTNVQHDTSEYVKAQVALPNVAVTEYSGGSSAGSWRVVFDYALTKNDDEIVYFVEDDYLHLPGSFSILTDGINIADYCSLYDHADKYIPVTSGGNPFIASDGGEVTKVFRTKNSHWKLTNSTTMTFATRVSTLRQDESIWRAYTLGSHPNDFGCFLKLRDAGRSLVTPIPGFSTHCEPQWASPGINWLEI